MLSSVIYIERFAANSQPQTSNVTTRDVLLEEQYGAGQSLEYAAP